MKKMLFFKKWFIATFMAFFLVTSLNCQVLNENPELSIVTDQAPGAPVLHGLNKLTIALQNKNIPFEQVKSIDQAQGKMIIVSGLAYGNGPASKIFNSDNWELPEVSEALSIWKTDINDKPTWVISGYDDRGLMYGLLDVAERIGWSDDPETPLKEVREITEQPDVKERAISTYTMNRSYWESRFYDEDYWIRYLDMLAQNRFNQLVIIFGYENGGFLAPPYPYFFNMEEFPDIRMAGLSAQKQQRNLASLKSLIKMAHDRGIKFSVGIWDHIYRGGVQGGGIPGTEPTNQFVPGLVYGLNSDNLLTYTNNAITKFIQLVPELDGIQFRMHGESGLKEGEQVGFWLNVFKMIKKTAPELSLVLRAKGMPESVIQSAIDVGVNFKIATKYWMEQMGMPYHPTHINRQNQFDRRHGYADMLRYPQQYKLHWKLWNGGTSRILLWGNPDYGRRFVESTHLYDGDGYEVNEPLATKMHGQPHDVDPFNLLNPKHVYYDYEFERYWYFFQVFGRIGYNPEMSSELWSKEFEMRYGKDAGPIIKTAIHKASWILPRIVSSVYNYSSSFPTTRGWPEKQRLGRLPLYADGKGSDIQQFASFDEEARILIEGGETAKILPSSNSMWFAQISMEIEKLIIEAENVVGNNRNKEFNSTMTDLKILSNLALYHSRRIPAAVSYRLFEWTKDVSALEEAIAYEREAVEAWRQIVVDAGDVYANDIMMGVSSVERNYDGFYYIKRLSGHWNDELILLEEGLSLLEQEKKDFKAEGNVKTAPHYKAATRASNDGLFQIKHQAVTSTPVGQPIKVSVKVNATNGVKWVRLRYRSVNQELDYQALQMLPIGEDIYQFVIPAEEINPKWDFMYFVEVMDNNGNGTIYPDLEKETPYIIVKLDR